MGKFDSVRTGAITVLPSAARTTTTQSADFTNDSSRGVHIVLTTTAITSAVNEVQRLVIVATGGTYTLTYVSDTTGALAHNASAATIETALRALPSIGGANVSVSPDGTGIVNITFNGALAGADVPTLVANGASLTGDTPTATVSVTTPGVPLSSITLAVEALNPVTGSYVALLTGAAVTSALTRSYRIYPGLTAISNITVTDVLPSTWRVSVTHGNSSPITYSIAALLLA